MTTYGADPQQLEHAAQKVESFADTYSSANQQIEYWLRRMEWDGPEAAGFKSHYSSYIRPQLDAMSGCLRQAAAHLRTQAADQLQASDAARSARDDAWDRSPLEAGSMISSMALGVLAGLPTVIYNADTLAGVSTFLAKYAKEIYGRPGLRFPDILRYEKIPKTVLQSTKSLFDKLPKTVSKGLGVAGIAISAYHLPGDAVEAYGDLQAIGDAIEQGDSAAVQEAIEQFGYSSSDVLLDLGGVGFGIGLMTGNPVVVGIGAGLLIAGGTVKLASFAYDHLREPVGQLISDISDVLQNSVAVVGDGVRDAVEGVASEVFEGRREIGGELREGFREISQAEGPIETTFEVFEAGAEVAGEFVEAGFEIVGSAARGLTGIGSSAVNALKFW